MSVRAMSQVWELETLTGPRKFVLLKLADYADDDGRNIFPAVASVARQCSTSKRTVQRFIKDFVAEGVLEQIEEGKRGYGGAPGKGRVYRIDFKTARDTYSNARVRGDRLSPLEPAGVTESCHPDDPVRGDRVLSPLEDLGVTLETFRGDRAVSPKPPRTTIDEEEESARGSPGDQKLEGIVRAEAVHERCMKIIGVDRSAPGMSLHRYELQWLESGCDPEQDIYPVVQEAWNWLKSKGREPPKTMKYFTKTVLEARDERRSFNQENATDQGHGSENQATRPEKDEELIQRIADRHRRQP